MSVKKPKVFRGRIYKVYFESLHTGEGVKPGRCHSCVVLARDATEAMQKAGAAFPRERVDTLAAEREYGKPHMEQLVI
jgi:hypothetical protein